MGVESELFSRILGYVKDAILDTDDKKWKSTHTSGKSYSSTSRAVSNLIAVHPILCSSNAKLETAMMIAKNVERRGATNLQMLLAAVNITNAKDGFEYLRQYHQNVNLGGNTMDDYADAVYKYIDPTNESSSVYVDTETTNRIVRMLKESYTQFYLDDYNESSLNDFQVDESSNGYTISVNPYKTVYNEASGGGGKSKSSNGKSSDGIFAELRDSDVKKANESVPSLLVVRFTSTPTTGDPVVTEFIIGVKAKIIPTNYMEILSKILNNNKDGHGLVNLIRATTGEMNFFRDYVLAIDRAKDDIASMRKKGSKEEIWKELEARAIKAKTLIRQGKTNYASAVTAVVITSEDADLLYKEENINIRDMREARKFMQAYNMFCFIIVNDTEESAWFLWDEDNPTFEKLSYTMLERESSDTQYKKILNLIGKMK